MSSFVSHMSDEYLKIWHKHGNNLKENLNKMLRVGDACINHWQSPAENNDKYNCLVFENRLLKYFDEIDGELLNMQTCIINVLRYLSYTRQQLEERVEFKNTHSKCQTKILELQQQNMAFQEKIQNEEKKSQMLVQKMQESKKAQRCVVEDQTIDTIYWYKEQEIQNLNREIGNINLENKYLKQRLNDVTEGYKDEIKKLQKHISEYEEKLEQMHINNHLNQMENRKSMTKLNDSSGEDIDTFRECFVHFIELYKNLLTENQSLRLKTDESIVESDSTELEFS